jgi:hypothetical protein
MCAGFCEALRTRGYRRMQVIPTFGIAWPQHDVRWRHVALRTEWEYAAASSTQRERDRKSVQACCRISWHSFVLTRTAQQLTNEERQTMARNVICLWYNGAAEEAARFYAQTFPNSTVTAVHQAPGEYPDGKQGQVLTVEFTVLGVPCLGLNGGPAFKHSEASDHHRGSGRDRSLLECDREQRRSGEPVWMVQGPLGFVLADHPARTH